MSHLAPPGPAMLFCPGNRPDRFENAVAAADTVILDLEDSVLPDDKAAARRAVAEAVHELDVMRLVVRVNGVGTPWFDDDVAALSDTGLRTIMLPKAESVDDLDAMDGFGIIALCETAVGILGARELAEHEATVMLAWGGQDLGLDLHSRPLGEDHRLSSTGRFAQLLVRFAGAAEGVPTIDTVRTDISDEQGLRSEARDAARHGFSAKLVIHPRQVAVIRAAFRPSEDEVERAAAIVEAARRAEESGSGVVVHQGQMVDAPVLDHARETLRRAFDDPREERDAPG